MDTRLTVERLHELRAQHLEQALRAIAERHDGDHPRCDGLTLAIALRALGEQAEL